MKARGPLTPAKGYAHSRPAGLEEEIRRRAHQIFEQRGRSDGKAVDDWVRAEAEILSHRVMRKTA